MSSKKSSPIQRNDKSFNLSSTSLFILLRLTSPFIQHQLLTGRLQIPYGPASSSLDKARGIISFMSIASMLKQNYWALYHCQERLLLSYSIQVGVANLIGDTLNTTFYLYSMPEEPRSLRNVAGFVIFSIGLIIEWLSEMQRHRWKQDAANKGQVFSGGLWSVSRHINYLGYTIWRVGQALACGGVAWSAAIGFLSTYQFMRAAVPEHEMYMEGKVSGMFVLLAWELILIAGLQYGEKFEAYKRAVPYKFAPGLF